MILESFQGIKKVAEIDIDKISDEQLEVILRIQVILGRRIIFRLPEEAAVAEREELNEPNRES